MLRKLEALQASGAAQKAIAASLHAAATTCCVWRDAPSVTKLGYAICWMNEPTKLRLFSCTTKIDQDEIRLHDYVLMCFLSG